MQRTRHVAALAIAAVMAAAMRGAAHIGGFGAQTLDSVSRAARMTPTRIARESQPRWFRSGRKGLPGRPRKHQRKKPIRVWRKARVLKLRKRRR